MILQTVTGGKAGEIWRYPYFDLCIFHSNTLKVKQTQVLYVKGKEKLQKKLSSVLNGGGWAAEKGANVRKRGCEWGYNTYLLHGDTVWTPSTRAGDVLALLDWWGG